MRKLILLLSIIGIWISSCESEEEIQQEKEVNFSISKPDAHEDGSGRIASTTDPVALMVTIKDGSGQTVIDRKELTLYKFGDTFLSAPITLKTSVGAMYRLTDFLVMDTNHQVIYVTPKEGSEMAHLVTDALDIEFAIDKNLITTVTPDVIEVITDSDSNDFGYGQFGFNIVNTIKVVFSSFIKGLESFQLTESYLKVEGLAIGSNDTTLLWTYEKGLEAKSNVITLKKADQYRITATRQGYQNWTKTNILENESKIEIILKKEEEKIDVYVAGYIGKDATYWKNGKPFTLEKSVNYTYSSGIYVFNSNVYVSGSTGERPLYWEGGVKKFLPVPSDAIRGQTGDIIVREDGVHVVGYYTSNHNQPAYWKNDVRTDLEIPSHFANGVADKFTTDGSDIYVTGYVTTWHTTLLTAALWKNGKFVQLPVPGNYVVSKAQGVKVSNGHVYVSGYITTSPYAPEFYISSRAVYWKDGVMNFIEPAKQSSASALDVEGSEVFIPFNVNGKTYYWKNGQQVFVGESHAIYELDVSKNDVYLVGTYNPNPVNIPAVACYWVNGKRVPLQSAKESQGISCFIVRGN